jgi:hypothetical protein
MRRFVAFAAAVVLLLLASQAVLAQYGPSGSLTVTPSSTKAGDLVAVSGSGCAPSASVQITLGSSSSAPVLLGTAAADVNGGFTRELEVPANAGGAYTVTATCVDPAGSVLSLTAPLEVAPAALPETVTSEPSTATRQGSDALVFAIAGVGIVLMTGVMLLATSRIRSVR